MTSTHLWNWLINTSYYHQIKVPMVWCYGVRSGRGSRVIIDVLNENFVLHLKKTMYFHPFYNLYEDFPLLCMDRKKVKQQSHFLHKKTWLIVHLVIDITKNNQRLGSHTELWICFTPLSYTIFHKISHDLGLFIISREDYFHIHLPICEVPYNGLQKPEPLICGTCAKLWLDSITRRKIKGKGIFKWC